MNSEIANFEDLGWLRGWVLYDENSPRCHRWITRFERILTRRGFDLAPGQSPWVSECLDPPGDACPGPICLLMKNGRRFEGMDAVIHLAGFIWWAWPLFLVSGIPGIRKLLRAVVKNYTAGRHDSDGLGDTRSLAKFNAGLPLVILLLVAMGLGPFMPAWGLMWALALALYAGCKWLTWRIASTGKTPQLCWRSPAYLLAWPGMAARDFLTLDSAPPRAPVIFWLFAVSKVLFGVTLVWGGVRLAVGSRELLAGWIGMVGLVFVLHFGVFHLLALGWQALRVNAGPIMRAPLLAASLSDFWSRRWNIAFHGLAKDFLFRPSRRWLGAAGATLLTFVVSGLIHELVISLPARGGYGGPTGYFVLQGFGVLLERSAWGARLRLRDGWTGWLFMVVFTIGPVFWLFHAVFLRRVMLPFLGTIGAF